MPIMMKRSLAVTPGMHITSCKALLFPVVLLSLLLNLVLLGREPLPSTSSGTTTKQPHKEPFSRSAKQKQEQTIIHSCLSPGPQPYILMSSGRSGTGSTWQILGNLTGQKTKSWEYTGSSVWETKKFFERLSEQSIATADWLLEPLCELQKKYPSAGLVGFKWKPYNDTIHHPATIKALQIASQTNPKIKIVRSKRNPLDMMISWAKHEEFHVPAHCKDKACQKKHLRRKVTLSTGNLLSRLEKLSTDQAEVDRLLNELEVPHVQVTYERLYGYHGDNTAVEEWMRILRFLGVGPAQNLTLEQVQAAMEHLPTSHVKHKEMLQNYKDIMSLLEGTEFEKLLHR